MIIIFVTNYYESCYPRRMPDFVTLKSGMFLSVSSQMVMICLFNSRPNQSESKSPQLLWVVDLVLISWSSLEGRQEKKVSVGHAGMSRGPH